MPITSSVLEGFEVPMPTLPSPSMRMRSCSKLVPLVSKMMAPVSVAAAMIRFAEFAKRYASKAPALNPEVPKFELLMPRETK